ncbi:hypothetical protein NDU88_001645 [Pleurodeles waltl]|uniref:Uncharacterized protein n=1 Tax=Pleurodeles waltl TaxID=8319 RepID=A0AAV7M123_PLEWA|nr:hypothetical protein NDU88_001645 [Pleurodeles waltl]
MGSLLRDYSEIKISMGSINEAVSKTAKEVQSLRSDIAFFHQWLDARDTRLIDIEALIDKNLEWSPEIWMLKQKVTDLEDNSRRDNIRITGVPEKMEEANMFIFLCKFLPKLHNLTFALQLEIQRAHRVKACDFSSSQRPCPILAYLLRHQHVRQIMSAWRKKDPYQCENHKAFISADFSQETNHTRKGFLTLLPRLQKHEIRYVFF